MKLLIATLTIDATVKQSFFFVKMGRAVQGQYIYNLPKIGQPEFAGYNDWDPTPTLLNHQLVSDHGDVALAIRDYAQREFLGNDVQPLISVDVREVVGDERQWFMTYGYEQHPARLINRLNMHVFSGRKYETAKRVLTLMNAKYDKFLTSIGGTAQYTPSTRFEYKGTYFTYATSYLNQRKFCKQVGAAVRESIRDDDASAFEDVFMENYIHNSSLHERIFDAVEAVFVEHAVSTGLEKGYCDHVDWSHEMTSVNVHGRERNYCQECRENEDVIVYADDIDEYIRRQDAYWDDNEGRWVSEEPESDDPDDNDDDTDRLMSYSTNALDHIEMDDSFESSPFGEFHMGIELEMVTRTSVNDAVEDVRDELGADYCICKTDGSLPSGGLEIVTAPRGLAEHIDKFKLWNISSDYFAWNGGKCGMHIHMDSRAFTKLTLGKFIMFFNADANADFIRKLAGRHPLRDEQARSYCAAEYQPAIENASKALKGKSPSRYYMVNTTCLNPREAERLGVQYVGERGFNTIELRIFRASLKKERLLAQIEFTHAAVMFCRIASMRDLNEKGFLSWLKSLNNRYPHLSDWYGIRRRSAAPTAPADATTTTTVSE